MKMEMPAPADALPEASWLQVAFVAVASLAVFFALAVVGTQAIGALVESEQICDSIRRPPIPSPQVAIEVYKHHHLTDMC